MDKLKEIRSHIILAFNISALKRFVETNPHQRDDNDYRTTIERVLQAASAASGMHKHDLRHAYLNSPYSNYDKYDDDDRKELEKSNPDLYDKIDNMSQPERTLYMLSMFLSDTFDQDPNLSTLQNYSREITIN